MLTIIVTIVGCSFLPPACLKHVKGLAEAGWSQICDWGSEYGRVVENTRRARNH